MKMKKLICLLLAVTMILGVCAGCGKEDEKTDGISEEDYKQEKYKLADVELTKDETVYVNLNTDGSVAKLNVSDHIQIPEPQVRIRDKSDLKNISDVKTFIEPVVEKDSIFWDMSSTDLYYNGTTDKKPPISAEITYYYNGKKMSPKRIEGKTGRIDIEISLTNNLTKEVEVSGEKFEISCPMIMAGGIMLSEESFKNVSVTNGTVIGDGSHQIVLMLGIPGMDESLGISSLNIPILSGSFSKTNYKISFDATDFAMGNIMFAAIPFSSISALSGEDMGDGTVDINQMLADIESVMNIFASQNFDQVMQLLYGDVGKTESLIKSISDAVEVYERNKPLIDLLSSYLTDENIDAISKLAQDVQAANNGSLGNASVALAELNTLLSAMSTGMGDISVLANDALRVLPILQGLEAALNTDEMQEITANLPDSVAKLKELRKNLEASKALMDSLSRLSNSGFSGQLKNVLDTAYKYTNMENMTEAQAEHFAGRMKEWLAFGQSYDIFSAKPDNAKSTVMFIYKTASIG